MRNLFRALGVCLVIMGTNSTAANLVRSSRNSRDDVEKVWCHLLTQLPKSSKYGLQSLFKSEAFAQVELVEEIVFGSRPLFAVYALDNAYCFAQTGNFVSRLDTWLDVIAEHIALKKQLFRNDFGLLGQISMARNSVYKSNIARQLSDGNNDLVRNYSSKLINHHFALLD